MVQFRPQAKEIIAKIVYYGPPLGGKTTNLRTLYRGYPPDIRGELVVVPTGTDRTIFFDFLPLSVGTLRGMNLRVQLYTVPGQVHFNTTRQVVLRGVDGVVFVADSQREMLAANLASYENLKENLLLQGLVLSELPHVVQYNKRDLKDVLSVEELNEALNTFNVPFYEAVATVGIGVEETLQGVVRLVARSLRDRFTLPPLEQTSSREGLFTHVPAGGGHIDRPFETAKIDPPYVVKPAPPAPPEEPRVPQQGQRAPYPGQEEGVLPFGPPPSRGGGEPPAAQAAPAEGPAAKGTPVAWSDTFSGPAPEPAEGEIGPRAGERREVVASTPGELGAAEPFPSPAGSDAFAFPTPASVEGAEDEVIFAVRGEHLAQAPVGAAAELSAPLLSEVGTGEPFLAAAPAAAGPGGGDLSRSGLEGEGLFADSPPLAPPPLIDPYADPFTDQVATPPPWFADVFTLAHGAEEEGAKTNAGAGDEGGRCEDHPTYEPLAPKAVEVEVGEGQPTAGQLVALPEVAVQRVLPRALAQFGEVRELELEVPVPAAWVGGRRMTLQLRLTLVPEEESHVR